VSYLNLTHHHSKSNHHRRHAHCHRRSCFEPMLILTSLSTPRPPHFAPPLP
jgi:hypothetical protein